MTSATYNWPAPAVLPVGSGVVASKLGWPLTYGPGVPAQESTIVREVIPAGRLGTFGRYRLSGMMSTVNNANAKTITLRLNGIAIASGSLANVVKKVFNFDFILRNTATDFVCRANLFDGDNDTTTALVYSSGQVDFTKDVSVSLTANLAVNTDYVTIEYLFPDALLTREG